jgi:hypothetical protein
VGDDGIERMPTQTLFDILEVPQRGRDAGACRRLAKLMRELGWSPIKARGLTRALTPMRPRALAPCGQRTPADDGWSAAVDHSRRKANRSLEVGSNPHRVHLDATPGEGRVIGRTRM